MVIKCKTQEQEKTFLELFRYTNWNEIGYNDFEDIILKYDNVSDEEWKRIKHTYVKNEHVLADILNNTKTLVVI